MPNQITHLSDVINPQVMGDMIEAKIPHMLKFTPFAKLDTSLVGVPGDTKTVPSWNFVGAATDVAEGVEVETKKLTASSTTFTIKKAMQSVSLTQESINSGLGDPIAQAESQLAKSIAVKLDADVLTALMTATAKYNGTGSNTDYEGVVNAVDVFSEEEITDKVMFVNPEQITSLRKDADFLSADKYQSGVMVSGEIGTVAGVRIVPSRQIAKTTYAYVKDNTNGTITIVGDSTNESSTNKHLATIQPDCYDTLQVGNKVKAESIGVYECPLVKLEPESSDTEYAENELPAVTIFLKKNTTVDPEWFPKKQCHDITAAKYYGVALTNASKVVIAAFKA